ncbi:MAG: TetR/AcrR family transcriptional regulator, partial [Chitinophagales bacterium]
MNIRDRILNACQELARIQGFYSMTMDELAERAGVSKRTLYRYFRSKEEVIEATLDQFMNEMATEADRLLAGNEQP